MVKIYYKLIGGHYHMRVFYHGKMGDLVCGEHEFDAIRSSMSGCAFIPDDI